MKRPHDQFVNLLMSLAWAVLLAVIGGIGAPPDSAAENSTTCNVQNGSCLKETSDGMTVEFDIQPKPVLSLSELAFSAILARSGAPVTDASVVLDLSMPGMYMGKNQPSLKFAKNGRYEWKGIIARCPSGSRIWQAELTIIQGGKTTKVDFVFEVK
ncbi:MAG TPA: hypothetical protein VEM40_04750 [Nitrospirota bacterium]|nr:hypothetical protein [Nitrospirota bacterium]